MPQQNICSLNIMNIVFKATFFLIVLLEYYILLTLLLRKARDVFPLDVSVCYDLFLYEGSAANTI